MLVRIARFHTTPPTGSDWIADVLRGQPGVRCVYHASQPDADGYISVTVLDDEASLEQAGRAISARRKELGYQSQPPDSADMYVVDHCIENF